MGCIPSANLEITSINTLKHCSQSIAPTLENTKPTSLHEETYMLSGPHAMYYEFNTLQRYGAWSLVPYKLSMNVVGCKLVYLIKRNSDGSIQWYKAMFVVNGFHQQPGIFFKTFRKQTNYNTCIYLHCSLL